MMTDWLTDPDAPLHSLPIYASPFAKAATGGGDDDEDPDDEDPDDEDPDDDDDEDDIAKLSDEELRAALKETREKLGKASNQSAKRRKALREKEAELEEARKPKRTPAPKAPAGKADDAPDLDEIRAEALREGEKKGIDRAKKSEARAALVAAGVSPDRVTKLVGMIDLDELDLDDDGLDGIDDAIDDLKKEWPELFARQRRRRDSAAGDGDRTGDGARKKELTPSQRQAAMVTGGVRR